MARTWARLGAVLAAIVILLSSGAAVAAAGTKPPAPYPKELSNGELVGIHKKTGEYCNTEDGDPKKRANCRAPKDCEDYPAGATSCLGEGSRDPEELKQFDLNALKRWQKKADPNAANYAAVNAFLEKCVKKGGAFQECLNDATKEHPLPAPAKVWVAGQISEAMQNALEEAASALGHSVVWLLKQFAQEFDDVSTIDLSKTGIGPVMGITTGLSVLVAAFLLLVQFGKLAVSQQGGPLVTAVTGLAKWGAILSVYLWATQVALDWSDTLSTALINFTFDGPTEGGDAGDAMEQQLGALFAGLVGTGGATAVGTALITSSGIAPTAVGFVIVISILCLLAIGALWIEMLVRQAGIMILVTMMPLALAGQMSDAGAEWWPKARNALIALILLKPTIVIVFSIGFGAMSGAEGVGNVIVGLIIFIVAAVSWPVLAKFIVITPNGEGTSTASGMISSAGSSVSSAFGGHQPHLNGAGTVGGGGAYTKAVESEHSSSSASGSGKSFWRGSGGFGHQVGNVIGVGLQAAAVGKDILESSFTNTAANAGLGHGAQGGRHVVIPPRGGASPRQATTEAESQPPQQQDPPEEPEPPAVFFPPPTPYTPPDTPTPPRGTP
ncbi:hypothetical protein ACFQ7N_38280 [Streptomyces niveus]|uniref:hypothetical protein n=1 Tax=Streptomyces niveus TaxID=193462 RepID=UPI0036876FB1